MIVKIKKQKLTNNKQKTLSSKKKLPTKSKVKVRFSSKSDNKNYI